MTNRAVISTSEAPAAIGPYSQAVKVGNIAWLSGQIPLDPATMELVPGGIEAQTRQAFRNLAAVAAAAGGSLDAAVKINIAVVDLADFDRVNAIMEDFFAAPFPARACVQVAALPKGAAIEIEAQLAL